MLEPQPRLDYQFTHGLPLQKALYKGLELVPKNSDIEGQTKAALFVAPYLREDALVQLVRENPIANLVEKDVRTLPQNFTMITEYLEPPLDLDSKFIVDRKWLGDKEKMFLVHHIATLHDEVIRAFEKDPIIWNIFTGGGDEPEAIAKKKEILGRLRSTNYVFADKDTYYSLMPDPDLVRKADGGNFWVQEASLAKALVYTNSALGFTKNPYLTYSSSHHELIHVLMSHTVPAVVEAPDGRPVELDANLVYPMWYLEGVANLVANRFVTSPKLEKEDTQKDFFDLLLEKWENGSEPAVIHESNRILTSSFTQPVPYFHHTLFTGFLLQTLSNHFHLPDSKKSDTTIYTEPNFPKIYDGLFLMNLASNFTRHLPFKLPEEPRDISLEFVKYLYDTRVPTLLARSNRLFMPTFSEATKLFDQYKDDYAANWMRKFCTPQQLERVKQVFPKLNIPQETKK